jgi:uncharacterized protein YhfF
MTLWQDYVAAHPEHAHETPPVEAFGDSPAMADRLLGWVLNGPKRATAGFVEDYAADNEPLPAVGSHWVVTDGAGTPRVVLRYTDLRTGRLDSVDDRFAWDEGEGDRTRDSWLADHREFGERRCAAQGIPVPPEGVDALEAVFQRFVVVWPPEHAD